MLGKEYQIVLVGLDLHRNSGLPDSMISILDQVIQAIDEVCGEQIFTQEQCVKRAKRFAFTQKYKEYIKLYKGNGTC